MRLPKFEIKRPRSMDEAVSLAAQYDQECRILGGGTDLLVGLKKRLAKPRVLLSLKNIPEFKSIRQEGAKVRIGPMVSLTTLAGATELPSEFVALQEAADAAATPQIRNQATIGGNVCLDTRCLYYNQSLQWVASLPLCIKRGGTTCHVVNRADRCYASFCADAVAALVALGAQATLSGNGGGRVMDVEALYSGKGESPHVLGNGELLSEVTLPVSAGKKGSAYIKFAYRGAIDFPLVGVAACLTLSGSGKCTGARLAAVGVTSRPERLQEAERTLVDQEMSPALIADSCAKAGKGLTIVAQQRISTSYRRAMLETMAGKAITKAWERAQSASS
ncbi:MAG: FAD binding domain-containing protein [Desulfobacterales bacterium]|nr:FAD binding domain-containing protein [Desulfobacterales bacterium]